MNAVEIEPLPDGSMLARIGGPDWKYGEPYEIMVVVSPIDEDACEIKGLDKQPTAAQWHGLEAALSARGYRFLEFTRIHNGSSRRHRRALPKAA